MGELSIDDFLSFVNVTYIYIGARYMGTSMPYITIIMLYICFIIPYISAAMAGRENPEADRPQLRGKT